MREQGDGVALERAEALRRADARRTIETGGRVARGCAFAVDVPVLAVLTDAVHGLHVEGDLKRPAFFVGLRQQGGAPALPDLLKAAARGCAGREPRVAVERGEVRFDLWVVVGIDDRDRLSAAAFAGGVFVLQRDAALTA